MKTICLLLLLISIQPLSVISQNASPSATHLPEGWERIYVKNTCSFAIPPTMEIQTGKYKQFVDEIKKIKGYDVSQIVAQPRGINEFSPEGFARYARVMFNTEYGKPDDYENLDFDTDDFTSDDILFLDQYFKQSIIESFIGTGLKLIEWHSIKTEKIISMSCIHVRYKRQLDDNPFVMVNMYVFHNNDRMHTLTLSYRISESDYWKNDLAKVLNSLSINKTK